MVSGRTKVLDTAMIQSGWWANIGQVKLGDYGEILNCPIAEELQGTQTVTPTAQSLADIIFSTWKILVYLTVANTNKAGVNRRLVFRRLKEDSEGRSIINQTVHQTFILGHQWVGAVARQSLASKRQMEPRKKHKNLHIPMTYSNTVLFYSCTLFMQEINTRTWKIKVNTNN